jgi:EAL domain-containing protein (putative c-di-GMP-specific phosphodiesterase class I)
VAQVRTVVQRHAINPTRLKLELTESMLVENVEGIISSMHTLKEMGIHFSLDHFGTGYSSLQYIQQMPLDQLKIDQSFVRNISSDPSKNTIVRTIIAMAKGMNIILQSGCSSRAGMSRLQIDKIENLLHESGCQSATQARLSTLLYA